MDKEFTMVEHIVDKVMMVSPLAFPPKSIYEKVNGSLEGNV